ncbi:hypothetical protein GCM10020254_33650 [Streptomyces goshikiensis]
MTGTGGRGGGDAQNTRWTGTRWAPGEQILWRYRDHAPGSKGQVHICRPVTVVEDTPELLAVWMAPGTECVKPVLADGTPVHAEPLATRYTAPRTTVRARWFGTGVLKLARPGDPWSVWLFWERGWRFKNWYVNLEEPPCPVGRRGGFRGPLPGHRRAPGPQLAVAGRGRVRAGPAARPDGPGAGGAGPGGRARRGRGHPGLGGPPFRDRWQDWRPDPAWGVPVLPEDWDRTPAHMTS